MAVDGSQIGSGWRQYGPGAVATPGSSTRKAPDPADPVLGWYEPAHTLPFIQVTVFPGSSEILSGAATGRKFLSVRNLSTVDTLWVGGTAQVRDAGPYGGWPVFPGEGLPFDGHEYDGDLYGFVLASAAGPIVVAVLTGIAGL